LTDRIFTENDLLADALLAHPGLDERLSRLHPYFAHVAEFGLCDHKKTTTLGEAAQWASLSAETFLSFVNCGAGLAVDLSDPAKPSRDVRPSWIETLLGEDIHEIDVRADLKSGQDPFKRIMNEISQLAVGEGFRLRAPFNPVPLRGVLAERGMASYGEPQEDGSWVVYFHAVQSLGTGNSAKAGVEDLKVLGRTAHLDVRRLEPPQPLVEILTLLDSPDAPREVFVRIHREPVFLFPELSERDWEYEVLEHKLNDEGEEFLLYLSKRRSAA